MSIDAGGAVTTYSYDSESRLTGINASGTLSTYTYDSVSGLRRTAAEQNGPVRTFVYDGRNYLQERD